MKVVQKASSCMSFLHYFHSAIGNHLSILISMSPEWMVAQNRLTWTEKCLSFDPSGGSLAGSREATPPYRQSISYNPPAVSENVPKPSARSASWTSELLVMPPLSVEVDQGNMMGIYFNFQYKLELILLNNVHPV